MINPTVRFYLPDVLKYGNTNKISEILNHTHTHRVFFWYDKGELEQKEIKLFVDEWEKVKHQNYKTHIQPYFSDLQRDFIWYDFMPHSKKVERNYFRFSWEYTTPKTIDAGLDEFKKTYDFVTDSQQPQKKQKRNDGEDSNYR